MLINTKTASDNPGKQQQDGVRGRQGANRPFQALPVNALRLYKAAYTR